MGKQQVLVKNPGGPGAGGWWWNWIVEGSFSYVGVFMFSVLLITLMYSSRESRLVNQEGSSAVVVSSTNAPEGVENNSAAALEGVANNTSSNHHVTPSCNIFSGNWVFDNKSYPLYKDWNCSFMFDDLACEKYHREDLNYQHWRWQPNDCDLPKFNAKALLEVLRNKRLLFVGDSLNRNQWVSFVCLIESSIPPDFKSRKLNGNLYTFTAKEYNTTIDFYWAPLLVESNSDDPSNHHLRDRVVRIQSIEKHAKHWASADILVFNSYLWWRSVPKLKVLRGSFGNPKAAVYKEMESGKCYKMALNTWSKWVLSHLDINKTRLFWISMSPTHTRPENWGMPAGAGKCMEEIRPIAKEELRGSETDPKIMSMTVEAIVKLKVRGVKIDFLDITHLSEYRKDAHPTIYRRQWRPLTKQQLANPWTYADCTHWCLPGVPDVWNEILYSYLIH